MLCNNCKRSYKYYAYLVFVHAEKNCSAVPAKLKCLNFGLYSTQ